MPFTNPVVGGTVLVRNAIQSQDFVTGVSGWRIARDGIVEFNSGVYRGSVEIGDPAGAHIILANSATGDAVDIYDSTDTLVYNITAEGAASSYDPTNTNLSVTVLDAEVVYSGLYGEAITFYFESATSGSSDQVQHIMTQLTPNRSLGYQLTAYGESPDGTKPPGLVGTERGVTGSVVQSDRLMADNLIHAAGYHITTDASGNCTFNHGCAFTPMMGFLAPTSVAGADFYQYTWLGSTFTSTQASAHFNDRLGNNKVSTSFFAFGVFWG